MEELLKLLESFHPVDPQLQIFLLHHLPKETHRANKAILEEGQVCDWIAFIEKGLLKIYYECEDMSERIVWFHKEGDVMGSMKSYYSGSPSKLTIRTMEETVLRRIKRTELEDLMQKFPDFNINARRITENYYSMSEDHVILLAMPPKERFKKIQEEYPWILKDPRIKDYMVAAYLGMDKATLSRYRRGIE
ncbi:Crp/Fnr family transcriptional regulator [Sediminibacterium sp.]|uniref:Crp/Fnr family transcriptional regulator n=1 Tax=Sediminibacterium sp. TaxID=1917865 RepID=UPI002731862A|nr:Crp/Fnr family transcriptional regulator [Sediminibacterium sp.]MDP2421445.1 Crp/Fnr family transcriptional regulator [Sediminibacterium sp.]